MSMEDDDFEDVEFELAKKEEPSMVLTQSRFETTTHKELEASIRRSSQFQKLERQLTSDIDIVNWQPKKELLRNLFLHYDTDTEEYFDTHQSAYTEIKEQIKVLAKASPYGYEMFNPILTELENMHQAFVSCVYNSSRLHYLYQGHYNALYKAYKDNTLGDINEALEKRLLNMRRELNTMEMITNIRGGIRDKELGKKRR